LIFDVLESVEDEFFTNFMRYSGLMDFWELRKAGAMVVVKPCVGVLGQSGDPILVKST